MPCTEHSYDKRSICTECGAHAPATLNGQWPTGTWLQRRRVLRTFEALAEQLAQAD